MGRCLSQWVQSVLRAEALGFFPGQPKPISRSDVQLQLRRWIHLGDATVVLARWLLPSYGGSCSIPNRFAAKGIPVVVCTMLDPVEPDLDPEEKARDLARKLKEYGYPTTSIHMNPTTFELAQPHIPKLAHCTLHTAHLE